jgi:uncharacterized protein
VNSRLEGDREALIEQLRNERTQAARDAELAERGELPASASTSTFFDPFKR